MYARAFGQLRSDFLWFTAWQLFRKSSAATTTATGQMACPLRLQSSVRLRRLGAAANEYDQGVEAKAHQPESLPNIQRCCQPKR